MRYVLSATPHSLETSFACDFSRRSPSTHCVTITLDVESRPTIVGAVTTSFRGVSWSEARKAIVLSASLT